MSMFLFVFFMQNTAYEMRISDWSSDLCSSDLPASRGWHCKTRCRDERGHPRDCWTTHIAMKSPLEIRILFAACGRYRSHALLYVAQTAVLEGRSEDIMCKSIKNVQ